MSESTAIAMTPEEWFKANGYGQPTFSNLGGSDWARQYKYTTGDGCEFFVKTARQSVDTMFKGEALGLMAMYHAGALRIPKVFHYGDDGRGGSYIVMEHLALGGAKDQTDFGRAMAKMHLATPAAKEAQNGMFGFDCDNTIGGTPQPNKWDSDWVRFFREQRIGHQVKLADRPQLDSLWKEVCEATNGLETLFEDVKDSIRPAVLHGDLWSGNIGACGSEPCIYDPATYYGHHEAEWGMSWCASLGPAFWKGYRELIPEDPGFSKRRALYELYHQLNHYNLFGGGYYNSASSLMQSLLRD
jgi:protein-ribulosamine 3-kinase